jgi:hypothetical protein
VEFSNKKLTLHYSLKIKPAEFFWDWSNRSLQPCYFAIFFFPPNTGAGYFFPQFVSAGIFFVQNDLAGNFFSKSPIPPLPSNKWSAPKGGP